MSVSVLLDLALVVLGLPVLLCGAYLLGLTLLSGRLPAKIRSTSTTRFRVVIPAHDEAAGIEATVRSVLALDYPRELFGVLVVADNCTDDTARLARSAGAEVLERSSETERGKGYALHHAFQRLAAEVDAVVVIDADTLVSPNLLRAFDARIAEGAGALQADYAVRNPDSAWRTRLIAIAFGAFHIVRSRARERLGLSVGLRGNGMGVTARTLRDVPHEAYSIVEDVEYGIRLAEAGVRVVYADEAHVYGEMVSSASAASSQRARWEGGRATLASRHATRLLRAGLRGNAVLLDLAADILVPPLSRIAIGALLGLVLSVAGSALLGGFAGSRASFGAALGAVVLYVLRGWMVSGTGLRGLGTLALAPLYVVWKLTVRGKKPAQGAEAEWVRTRREGAEP